LIVLSLVPPRHASRKAQVGELVKAAGRDPEVARAAIERIEHREPALQDAMAKQALRVLRATLSSLTQPTDGSAEPTERSAPATGPAAAPVVRCGL
jgi:hypothetical protein